MNRSVPRPRIRIVDAISFDDVAADTITRHVMSAIRRKGRCSLALAGGGTPRSVYERMALAPFAHDVAWESVSIFFGDERCVPPDDPQSNYGMASEALLQRVPIPVDSVHRMDGERADHDAAAGDYERLLPERLDVLLLGMGADGHTASLFPGSSALSERQRRVVSVHAAASPPCRLTITPPVIHAAGTVIVMVTGSEKADAVARALEGDYAPDRTPVQHALDATWLLDRAAAQALAANPTGE